MAFTFDSVLITLVVSWTLNEALKWQMTHPKSVHKVRTDFLTLLVVLIFVRMYIPMQILVGIRLIPGVVLRFLFELLESEWFMSLSGYTVLSWIWLIGALLKYWQLRSKRSGIACMYSIWTQHAVSLPIQEIMPEYGGPDCSVWISPVVRSPFVLGNSKEIFLPDTDYTASELRWILSHELQHLYNMDICYLEAFHYNQIFYWWLPWIKSLENNLNLFFEIRVDNCICSRHELAESLDYCQCLVTISRKAMETKVLQSGMLAFGARNEDLLSYRVRYSLESPICAKTQTLYTNALKFGVFSTFFVIVQNTLTH